MLSPANGKMHAHGAEIQIGNCETAQMYDAGAHIEGVGINPQFETFGRVDLGPRA